MKELYIKDLTLNKKCELLCWIANKRVTKNVLFLDVYDSTGSIQAVIEKGVLKQNADSQTISLESAVRLNGQVDDSGDFVVDDIEVIAAASLSITPSPNYPSFNPFERRFGKHLTEHPTFYVRNIKLRACYYVKSVFKRELQSYLWERGFVEFESPTLTRQTLYDDIGAIWLDANHPDICLSRCATFHLEPAVIAYEKVFTIANSHADEKIRTNRHLVEYMHLKAELCWCNLDELVKLAGEIYYEAAKRTVCICRDQFNLIVSEERLNEKIHRLDPSNHAHISYDEAVELLHSKGVSFEYGRSLTATQEKVLTKHFGENFLWVQHIPYTVEGFMFKRLETNEYLTKTCDLIAPEGFGEILGCAEKMTDYDELIKSMEQKGKIKDYERYRDYALLHKLGLPPHGGIGMGIERAVRYLLDVDHVKFTKPFAVVKGTQINH